VTEDATGGRFDFPAEMSFGELFVATFRVYKSVFLRVFPVIFAAILLANLLVISILISIPPDTESTIAGGFIYVLFFSRLLIPGSISIGVAAAASADAIAGQPVTARRSLSALRGVLKDAIAASLLALIIFLILFGLLQGFPGLFNYLFYGPPLVMQLIVLERVRLQQAIPRARQLGKGFWLRTFTYLFCVALGLVLLRDIALQALLPTLGPLIDEVQQFVQLIPLAAIEAVMTGFFGVLATLIYFDLRGRKEEYGIDELRADRARD
jgi:hypothetical protein